MLRRLAQVRHYAVKIDQRQLAAQREREQKRQQLKKEATHTFNKLKTEARLFKTTPHTMDVPTAMRYLRSAEVGFNPHSTTISLNLRVVAEKGVQRIGGALKLPHSLKEEKLMVLTNDSLAAEQAKQAGAAIVGGDEIINKIKNNMSLDVDRIYATPEIMGKVSSVARILGPKGLMPNVKRGTVTSNVYETILNAKGETTYKQVDDTITVPIARADFSDVMVVRNVLEAVNAFRENLGKAQGKRGVLGRALLSSTRGPSISIVV